MRAKYFLFILLLILSLLFSACATPTAAPQTPGDEPGQSEADQPASGDSTSEQLQYALIVKNLVNPYWVNLKNGAEAAAKQNGVKLDTLAPEQPDNVEEQAAMIENLIQAGVDGIILVPANSEAIVPAVEKAKAANIPVFTADTRVVGTDVLTFVGIDNVELATNIAQWVKDYVDSEMGSQANIVILEGVPGSSSAKDRQDGFMSVLGNADGINILASQTAKYNRVEAVKVTEDMLTRFPELDIILAANDEMALGAIEAIEARGLVPGDDIKVVGINAAENALEAMEQGRLSATIYANEYCMGYAATEAAVKFVAEGVQPEKEVLGKLSKVVTPENLEAFKQEQAAGSSCQ